MYRSLRYMEADDIRQAVACVLDGRPVPAPVAAFLSGHAEAERLAKFGKVLTVVDHDFGSPAGICRVVCEKWAGCVVPGGSGPWQVQDVLLTELVHLGAPVLQRDPLGQRVCGHFR